jgi:threonine/homoserine/homoserine lactone efflux protein
MNGIIQMFFLGFLIGLTGALAPGPTLIATINTSLKGGWSMGPRVTFGHIFVEILMVILIIAGLSVILGGYSWIVAGVGGVALVVFGTLTILESRHPGINFGQRTPVENTTVPRPFVAGVVTSMSNPYFWLWWFSVGSALMISAYAGGLATAAAFILGHWTADLGWYTLVSTSIHRGRFFLGEREYRWTLAACGIFLVFFGGYYLISFVYLLGFGQGNLPI